jgi:enamine deaminase RidA (YjgF/YER057c/UK114 family)
MSVLAKLKELKIELPPLPPALASYVPAKRLGNLVYVSGQLPFLHGELMATGKLGELLEIEDGQELSKRCFVNALAAASSVVDLEEIRGVLRIGGWVASAPLFVQQHLVLNGASDLAQAIFGVKGQHVRAAVGSVGLPMNAPVEAEVIFTLD